MPMCDIPLRTTHNLRWHWWHQRSRLTSLTTSSYNIFKQPYCSFWIKRKGPETLKANARLAKGTTVNGITLLPRILKRQYLTTIRSSTGALNATTDEVNGYLHTPLTLISMVSCLSSVTEIVIKLTTPSTTIAPPLKVRASRVLSSHRADAPLTLLPHHSGELI